MSTYAVKNQNEKSQSATKGVSKAKSDSNEFVDFFDQQSEAEAKSKIQELANRSSQSIRLASFQQKADSNTNNSQPVQLKKYLDLKKDLPVATNGPAQLLAKEEEISLRTARPMTPEIKNTVGNQMSVNEQIRGFDKSTLVKAPLSKASPNINEQIKEFDKSSLEKTPFSKANPNIAANAAIKKKGEILEKIGNIQPPPNPYQHNGKKDKVNTPLGADLARIQNDIGSEGYDFNPESDSQNVFSRFAGKKWDGIKNYAKKHPGKTAAKLVPLVPIGMNIAGAVRSHFKSKDAEGEEQNPDATQAQQLMWDAQKKSQKTNRNKKGIAAAMGIAATAAGGFADFGAGEAGGQLLAASGSEFIDKAGAESFEMVSQFVGQNSFQDAMSGFGLAAGEMGVEEVMGNVSEDVVGMAPQKSKGLIPKARLARIELNKQGGDSKLAHESLLAKDLKYGASVRKAVRGTLDETLPVNAAPSRGEVLSPASGAPVDASMESKQLNDFETAKKSKSHLLNHLKETVGFKADIPSYDQGSDTNLKPSDFAKQQRDTRGAAMHRLRKDLGYASDSTKESGSKILSKKEAEIADSKIDNFKEKAWWES